MRLILEGHLETGGLWDNSAVLDGSAFLSGVDGSGGSRSRDSRARICSWGVAAVALNAAGAWECVARIGGVLPGSGFSCLELSCKPLLS